MNVGEISLRPFGDRISVKTGVVCLLRTARQYISGGTVIVCTYNYKNISEE